MKKSLLSLLLVLASTSSLLVSCKKDAEPDQAQPAGPGYTTTELSGAIVLPSGSPRDVNALRILSPVAAGSITTGRYQVQTIQNEFTTQIAADASGQPVLMGYAYPGQTDFTINAQSTVLAMLMNTGSVYSLTPTGRQQLVAKVKADPDFTPAVQEVERILRTPGTALLDTANTVLGGRVAALFTSVARRTKFGPDQAVSVFRAGRTLTFTNAGVPFLNTVGIYKDGQQVQQLDVDGQNFFAASLSSGAAMVRDGLTPATVSYTLAGDGQFDVRIRSGKFGSGANGPEQLTALGYNLAQGAMLLVSGVLPQFKGKAGCAQAVAVAAKNQANNFKGFASSASTLAGATKTIYKIAKSILDDAPAILQRCEPGSTGPSATGTFAQLTGPMFKFTDALITRVGNGMNALTLTTAWLAYPAAQDTCFKATGSTVGACGDIHLTIVSGNNQTGPANRALPDPVRVRVLDENNNPRSGVSVTFSAAGASGAGSATPPLTTSDANGYAQASWTLGTSTTQRLTATARDAAGQPVPGATVDFSASVTGAKCMIQLYTQFGVISPGTSGSMTVEIPNVFTRTLNFFAGNVLSAGGLMDTVSMVIPVGQYSGTVRWNNPTPLAGNYVFDIGPTTYPSSHSCSMSGRLITADLETYSSNSVTGCSFHAVPMTNAGFTAGTGNFVLTVR